MLFVSLDAIPTRFSECDLLVRVHAFDIVDSRWVEGNHSSHAQDFEMFLLD